MGNKQLNISLGSPLSFLTILKFSQDVYRTIINVGLLYTSGKKQQPLKVFCETAVLKNFTKFTGKHLYRSLFLNKVTDPKPATLLKRTLRHRCFPVNFMKFLRIAFCRIRLGNCF